MQDAMRTLVDMLRRQGGGQLPWLEDVLQRGTYGDLPCAILPIVASPLTEGYRNKCEFTIGSAAVAGQKELPKSVPEKAVVGFRLGLYRACSVSVAPVDTCRHIPHAAVRHAQFLEDFLSSSPLPYYDPVTHAGVWRQLLVRVATTNEVLVCVQVSPNTTNLDELTREKQRLAAAYQKASHEGALQTTTFVWQVFAKRCARPQSVNGLTSSPTFFYVRR